MRISKKFFQILNFDKIKLLAVQADNSIIKLTYNLNLQEGIEQETDLICELRQQLDKYFVNKLTNFDIPILLIGTDFQKAVWESLQKIPYGETRTYKQIAEMIGNPKACRAVGFANNQNPVSIIVPCHRVIGSNKKLIGYAGGLQTKQFLLDLEKIKLPIT